MGLEAQDANDNLLNFETDVIEWSLPSVVLAAVNLVPLVMSFTPPSQDAAPKDLIDPGSENADLDSPRPRLAIGETSGHLDAPGISADIRFQDVDRADLMDLIPGTADLNSLIDRQDPTETSDHRDTQVSLADIGLLDMDQRDLMDRIPGTADLRLLIDRRDRTETSDHRDIRVGMADISMPAIDHMDLKDITPGMVDHALKGGRFRDLEGLVPRHGISPAERVDPGLSVVNQAAPSIDSIAIRTERSRKKKSCRFLRKPTATTMVR